MAWLEITVRTERGDRSYFVRHLGLIENGQYRIVGSIPQRSISDDRFKLDEQFRQKGTHYIVPGNRLVAQALRETERNEKLDYVLLPGLITNVNDSSRWDRYVQLRLPFPDNESQ